MSNLNGSTPLINTERSSIPNSKENLFDERINIIHCCLTVNSTTLYTYDNPAITNKININYAELISKNVGLINYVQEDRNDDYALANPITLNGKIVDMMLYYNKKLMKNNDLITILILSSGKMLSSFIYNILEKLMNLYLDEYYETPGPNINVSTTNNFEFKLKMKEIISNEEKNLITLTENYGSIDSEISEVRNLMNENIDKILERGENLETLINKTQNLNSSANSFRRRTVSIKRKFWWSNVKFFVLLSLIIVVIFYILMGLECGLPFYKKCLHPSKPHQPPLKHNNG